jgi:hypothetical protein
MAFEGKGLELVKVSLLPGDYPLGKVSNPEREAGLLGIEL